MNPKKRVAKSWSAGGNFPKRRQRGAGNVRPAPYLRALCGPVMALNMEHDREILLSIKASPGRHWMGVISMYLLGLLLIYVAFARPPSFGWLVFLLAFGCGSLWLAEKMRRATERVINLSEAGLHDDTGTVIAAIEDINKIDRGVFAFKPSNGFLIRLKTKDLPRRWEPGLWWRLGRQVGIGGVTAASQSKPVAELLQAMVAKRDGLFDGLGLDD